MPNHSPSNLCHFFGRLILAILIPIILLGTLPASAQTQSAVSSTPCLQAGQILTIAQNIALSEGTPDASAEVVHAAFVSSGGKSHVTAYEENSSFVYAVARLTLTAGAPKEAANSGAQGWRRFIVLGGSTFIVDDEAVAPTAMGLDAGCVATFTVPEISGREARVREASGQISLRLLFPNGATYQAAAAGPDPGLHLIKILSPVQPTAGRFVQILRVGKDADLATPATLTAEASDWKLTVTAGDRIFSLTLPPPADGGRRNLHYYPEWRAGGCKPSPALRHSPPWSAR